MFKKPLYRYSTWSIGSVLLLIAVAVVVFQSSDNNSANQAVVEVDNNSNIINPLSVVSKAEIAYQVASMAGIYETIPTENSAESQSAAQNIPLDDQLISEPVILATSVKTRANILTYKVVAGDSLSSLAVKYGVTSQSIAESNSITDGELVVGSTIYIPPVNGLVYVVKSGDTAQTLATTYNANASDITTFNDAEINGLSVGERIVIPNGSISIPVVSYYSTSYSNYSFAFGNSAIYGSNGYDFGYCTWYVSERRAQTGDPIPQNLGNAITWYPIAVNEHLSTGLTPKVGSVIWFGLTDDPDHVAYVEGIAPDGSLLISEMNAGGYLVTAANSQQLITDFDAGSGLDLGLTRNGGGWDVIDYRVVPASQVGDYRFIY
jgi:surface antigen